MNEARILLDSNAYLRLANTFHPLLHSPFGSKRFCLYLTPEFQKEFDKSPRLKNKFGWVNQPEYIQNRKGRLKVSAAQTNDVQTAYSYLWQHNASASLGASRIDTRALAYGAVLGVPVVTDDKAMKILGEAFGITVWGILDLLKVMVESERIELSSVKTLVDYLHYIKDLPSPNFINAIKATFPSAL